MLALWRCWLVVLDFITLVTYTDTHFLYRYYLFRSGELDFFFLLLTKKYKAHIPLHAFFKQYLAFNLCLVRLYGCATLYMNILLISFFTVDLQGKKYRKVRPSLAKVAHSERPKRKITAPQRFQDYVWLALLEFASACSLVLSGIDQHFCYLVIALCLCLSGCALRVPIYVVVHCRRKNRKKKKKSSFSLSVPFSSSAAS